MNKEKEIPKRKNLRLQGYDYSSKGAYFVTVCTKDRKKILSDVIKPVGVGALDDPRNKTPQISLTEIGKTVEKYLLSSENISGVKIDKYVIMPEHIHAVIILDPNEYEKKIGSSKAPTPTNKMLPHIISTFKRFCNKDIGEEIFQRGYIEHIIRDREDYETRVKYIYENPVRRYYDKLNEKSN